LDASLVIVGASHAGTQLAISARERGYSGKVLLVGEENALPYQRPPLSKGFIKGQVAESGLLIRPASFYENQGIELLLGTRIAAIRRPQRVVVTSDNASISYTTLALATGARVRILSCTGSQLKGIHYLRNWQDAQGIKSALQPGKRVAIVGGGFIGLELAAACASLGLKVSVVEAQDRLLERALPGVLAAFLKRCHKARGVRFIMGRKVDSFEGKDGRVAALVLDDGEAVSCDLSLVGIGVVPNVELAATADLGVADGILVDRNGATPDPCIFAIGDCARYPNPWAADPTQPIRLESIQSANDLARAAACAIVGAPASYDAVPWFWSDQYDLKLQMAGLGAADDELVVRGDMAAGKFSLCHFRRQRLVAVDSVNDPRTHMSARRLIAQGTPISPREAADASVDMGLIAAA
jgi:3-phenylpropionate/trans-cinnamate dioxygenase ferredoxin reductase subunit